MDVKEAARVAKEYLFDLFAAEEVVNVGLEEVDFDDLSNDWKITIGFSRPWDQNNSLTTLIGERRPARSYKVIRISNESGQVKSVKDRILVDSN